MTIKRWILVLAGLALIAAACGTADAAGPPDIKYGRDICLQCGMIVSEEKFAAAYTLESGEERSFDDLGDLILYMRDTNETINPLKGWVHDYETEEWVDLANAHFVPTLSVSTPMGHGIIAFSDEERAASFAADVDGEVIGWVIVEQLPAMDNLVGSHHHDHADHDHSDQEDMDHDEEEMESDTDMDMSEGHDHGDGDT
ncbi:MAG: nitrous oxide reductase accessory protein NosL [Acidimicrobiia bacterium]